LVFRLYFWKGEYYRVSTEINKDKEFEKIVRSFRRNGSDIEMNRSIDVLLQKIRFKENPSEFMAEHSQKNLEFSILTGGDIVSSFERHRESTIMSQENTVNLSDIFNHSSPGNNLYHITIKLFHKSLLKRERKVNWKTTYPIHRHKTK